MAKKIMIVDDEREYTRLFRQMLERGGYEIVEMSKGSDVLRRLLAEPFDLVLLDYQMKDIRGDRVCRNIRSEEKLKELPLIMVTAHRELDEAYFKSMGANEVIYKPVSQSSLREAVEKYLGSNNP